MKAGYFNEPSSMSLNASLYNYHFISRAAPAMALSAGRGLGITYKYYDATFFADQGLSLRTSITIRFPVSKE